MFGTAVRLSLAIVLTTTAAVAAQPASVADTVPSLTLFLDETAFVQASGAVVRVSYPTRTAQSSTYVENGVTLFNARGLFVKDSTRILPGNELGIVDEEHLDITFPDPVLAFGMRVQDGCRVGAIEARCDDSQWALTFKRGELTIGAVTVDPPLDTASFVGVVSSARFDRVEIREVVGGVENDFFGAILAPPEPSDVFYSAGTLPNADPVAPWIASHMTGGVTLSGDGLLRFRDTDSTASVYQRNIAALRVGASWTMEFRANYQTGSLWAAALSELKGRHVGICFETNKVSDCGGFLVTETSQKFIIPGVDPRGWHVWRVEKDGLVEARIYMDGNLIRVAPYDQIPMALAREGSAVFGAGSTSGTAISDLDYFSYSIGSVTGADTPRRTIPPTSPTSPRRK